MSGHAIFLAYQTIRVLAVMNSIVTTVQLQSQAAILKPKLPHQEWLMKKCQPVK